MRLLIEKINYSLSKITNANALQAGCEIVLSAYSARTKESFTAYEDAAKFAFTGMKRKKIAKELMSHYSMILNQIINNQYSNEEPFRFCSTCYEKNKRTNKFCAKCGDEIVVA